MLSKRLAACCSHSVLPAPFHLRQLLLDFCEHVGGERVIAAVARVLGRLFLLFSLPAAQFLLFELTQKNPVHCLVQERVGVNAVVDVLSAEGVCRRGRPVEDPCLDQQFLVARALHQRVDGGQTGLLGVEVPRHEENLLLEAWVSPDHRGELWIQPAVDGKHGFALIGLLHGGYDDADCVRDCPGGRRDLVDWFELNHLLVTVEPVRFVRHHHLALVAQPLRLRDPELMSLHRILHLFVPPWPQSAQAADAFLLDDRGVLGVSRGICLVHRVECWAGRAGPVDGLPCPQGLHQRCDDLCLFGRGGDA